MRIYFSLATGEMLRTVSVNEVIPIRRRFSTWRKSSLISKIHQSEAAHKPPAEKEASVMSVSTVRGMIHCHTLYLQPQHVLPGHVCEGILSLFDFCYAEQLESLQQHGIGDALQYVHSLLRPKLLCC